MAIGQNTASQKLQVAARRPFNALDYIALVLLVVGGLNWGLVGLLQFDLVAALFGPMSLLSRVVYVLVGLAALWGIVLVLRRPRA